MESLFLRPVVGNMMQLPKSTAAFCLYYLLLFGFFTHTAAKKVTYLDTMRVSSSLNWPSHASLGPAYGWMEETQAVGSTNHRTLAVCTIDRANADNWLRTEWIPLNGATNVHIELQFTMRDCTEFPGEAKSCKETFKLYAHESDREYSAGSGRPRWNDSDWTLVDNIAADNGRFSSPNQIITNSETLRIPVDKKGVYFALRDNGACVSVLSVTVWSEECDSITSELATFPSTPTGREQASLVAVRGQCVQHAAPVNANEHPSYMCKADATWDARNGKCACEAGFQPNGSHTECTACRPGTYQHERVNGPCVPCPAHSTSATEGGRQCACDEGYFRAEFDSPAAACTTAPGRPVNVNVVQRTDSSIGLQWQQPLDLGGRKTVWYRVDCRNCPPSTQITPDADRLNVTRAIVRGLKPDTLYEIVVHAENAVSHLGSWHTYSLLEERTLARDPMLVRALQTERPSRRAVQFSWQPPELATPTAQVLYYEVSMGRYHSALSGGQDDSGSGGSDQPERRRVQATSAHFDQLLVDSRYSFQVRAVTSLGNGEWSQAVVVDTYEPAGGSGWTGVRLEYVIVFCAVIVLLLVVVVVLCYWRHVGHGKQGSDSDPLDYKGDHSITPDYHQYNAPLNNVSSPMLTYYPGCHTNVATLMRPTPGLHRNYVDPTTYIDPNELLRTTATEIGVDYIIVEDVIGAGEFGQVCKGRLRQFNADGTDLDVAIKTLNHNDHQQQLPDGGDRDGEKTKFLAEASKMGQFDHPNVIKLIGVQTQVDPAMIIMEYMEYHSLLMFLDTNRGSAQLDVQRLVCLLRDVAAGMKYLADMNYVHRDLAARNVLVNGALQCKIADFGLSRETEPDGDNIYSAKRKGKIPVIWTAPEAITHSRYDSSSDVWSFGVVAWEVFSFGTRPYADWNNQRVIQEVDKGYRLPCPEGCPRSQHQMMLHCWRREKQQRPSFGYLYDYLNACVLQPAQIYVQYDRGYDCTATTSTLPRCMAQQQQQQQRAHTSSTSTVGTSASSTGGGGTLPHTHHHLHQQQLLCDTLAACGVHGDAIQALLRNGVGSLDALARLTSLDYRCYGVEPDLERTIRSALQQSASGSRTMGRGVAQFSVPPPPRLPPALPPSAGASPHLIHHPQHGQHRHHLDPTSNGFFV